MEERNITECEKIYHNSFDQFISGVKGPKDRPTDCGKRSFIEMLRL